MVSTIGPRDVHHSKWWNHEQDLLINWIVSHFRKAVKNEFDGDVNN